MSFDNGCSEKHQPCSSCGRYVYELHEDGTALKPNEDVDRFADGSTGEWTCTRCANGPGKGNPQETSSSNTHLFS